jgi:hypothetical protein
MRLGLAAAVLALAVALAAAAGAAAQAEPPKADLFTTGDHSELIKTVPIAKTAGTNERVVMSLGPDKLPRIQNGDRLRASGEVQFSTTCVDEGPKCIGRPYQVNPTLSARIILAAAPDQTDGGLPLSDEARVRCKQQRPNRNHHCTLAMPNRETTIGDIGTLPCAVNACYVNMVVEAVNRHAKRGNQVVVGADQPDGSVEQDKGRLNLVQARAEVPPPTLQSTSDLVSSDLPLTEGKKVKRRVIHSIAIAAPRKGDVLAFDGGWVGTIDQLPFNTFLSTRVILGESPTSTEPTGVAVRSVQNRGDASESNGFNCTQGPSGYASPCRSVKAGAIRITQDVIDPASGLPGTLYLNLVAAAKPLLAKKVKNSQRVLIGPSTGLSVARYAAPASTP